jgi:hypothetical protein
MTHPTTAGAQAVITDERIEDIEGVIACLGDDAAQIRLELANCRPNKKGFICEEWAESMERAAELLADLLAASPAAPATQPEAPLMDAQLVLEYVKRYAWLRSVLGAPSTRQDRAIAALNAACANPKTPEQFDAAIDAAIASLEKPNAD